MTRESSKAPLPPAQRYLGTLGFVVDATGAEEHAALPEIQRPVACPERTRGQHQRHPSHCLRHHCSFRTSAAMERGISRTNIRLGKKRKIIFAKTDSEHPSPRGVYSVNHAGDRPEPRVAHPSDTHCVLRVECCSAQHSNPKAGEISAHVNKYWCFLSSAP